MWRGHRPVLEPKEWKLSVRECYSRHRSLINMSMQQPQQLLKTFSSLAVGAVALIDARVVFCVKTDGKFDLLYPSLSFYCYETCNAEIAVEEVAGLMAVICRPNCSRFVN